MHCSDYEPLFSRYIDGDLEREQSELFRFHLKGCPRCRAILDDMQRTVSAVQALTRVTPRPEFEEALRHRLRQEMTQDLYTRPVWTRWADVVAELSRFGLQRPMQVVFALSMLLTIGIGVLIFRNGAPSISISRTPDARHPVLSSDLFAAASESSAFSTTRRSLGGFGLLTRRSTSSFAPVLQAMDTVRSALPVDEGLSISDSAGSSQTLSSSELYWIAPEPTGNGVVIAETSPATVRPRRALPLRSPDQSERLFDLTGNELTGKRGQSSESTRGGPIFDGRDGMMHYILPTIPSRQYLSRVNF